MFLNSNLNERSFLIYGLGLTGKSVVKFFKRNNIKNYTVWDDKTKNLYKRKRAKNLKKEIKKVDHIVLSPGINIYKSKNKKILIKNKNKIITDIDLIFLQKKKFKSIVVTGTNGKSTTCQLINHVLKQNGFKTFLGGNIGKPVLDIKLTNNSFLVIEASSFQLSHSKFISPDFAFLLNIANDHLDWHGSKNKYINAKFKVFKLQKKNQYAFLNKELKNKFKKRNLRGRLIIPKLQNYKKLKTKIQNSYLTSIINDENMNNVLAFSNLIKIKHKSFIQSVNSFKGLKHRYEIFLKRKNCTFINDSKATSFQSTKFALSNSKNIFWIVGGFPKKNDKIILKNLRNNIIKCYIIGKHINFFKKQIINKIDFYVAKTLKKSIIKIYKDIRLLRQKENIILLSPSAASYDQYLNFEKRGENFKKLVNQYAKKFI